MTTAERHTFRDRVRQHVLCWAEIGGTAADLERTLRALVLRAWPVPPADLRVRGPRPHRLVTSPDYSVTVCGEVPVWDAVADAVAAGFACLWAAVFKKPSDTAVTDPLVHVAATPTHLTITLSLTCEEQRGS